MSSFGARRAWGALFFSLAVHAAAVLWVLLLPPQQKPAPKEEELLVTIEFEAPPAPIEELLPDEPLLEELLAEATTPEALSEEPAAEITTPDAPKDAPKEEPNAPSATPQTPAAPESTGEPPQVALGEALSESEGIPINPNTEPSTRPNKGLPRRLDLDPKKQLSFDALSSIIDPASPNAPGRRERFIKEQYGGPTSAPTSLIGNGNTRKLAAAKLPFVDYLRVLHREVHPYWAEGALVKFEEMACDHPANDPDRAVTLEIVIQPDGSLERAVPLLQSGAPAFDTAALEAVYDASPFPAPPKDILSYDGKVYLRWEFHRDMRQCGSVYAQAFLLTSQLSDAADAASSQPVALLPKEELPPFPEQLKFLEEIVEEPPEQMPTFLQKAKSAIVQMPQSCKDKLNNLRSSFKEKGALKTFFTGFLVMEMPRLCKQDATTLEFDERGVAIFPTPPGPPDEISFPPCQPSCAKLCFTF